MEKIIKNYFMYGISMCPSGDSVELCNTSKVVQDTHIIEGGAEVIAELFIPQYTPITYKDGNRHNCRLDNLILGSSNASILRFTELHYSNENINNTPIIEGGFSEGQNQPQLNLGYVR